jgi:hypothetical protein
MATTATSAQKTQLSINRSKGISRSADSGVFAAQITRLMARLSCTASPSGLTFLNAHVHPAAPSVATITPAHGPRSVIEKYQGPTPHVA